MPYSTTVDVIDLEGGAYPSATGSIWMLWTVLNTGGGGPTGPQQQNQGDDTVQTTGSSFPLSFAQGPDNNYSSRQIGISIQDTNRVAGMTGWWFRSGSLAVLPSQNIEVVLANAVDFTQAELDASLPPMPMTVNAQTSITSVTAMLRADGFIDLVANGTTTAAGPAVTFVYTLVFKIVPSSSIAEAETEVFDIETQDRGSIVFAGTGVGALTAAILNAVSSFILREVFPIFRNRLKAGLNTAVISQIAGRIAPGTTALPTGVIVSARSVNISATKITVRAALGAYGGVFSKFPPPPPGSTKPCGMAMLISAAAIANIQPDVFRLFRDEVLASSDAGKTLISLYYKHSAEAARIVMTSPGLAGRSTCLLLELQKSLRQGHPVGRGFISKCRRLTVAIARRASPEFRVDIEQVISTIETNHFFGLAGTETLA